MIKDTRRMSTRECVLLMDKVLSISTYKNTNVRFDEMNDEWHVETFYGDNSSFKGFGRGNINDGITGDIHIQYSPPGYSNIRFEIRVSRNAANIANSDSEVINKFNSLLSKIGGKGMSFLSNFENLEVYSKSGGLYPTEFINSNLKERKGIIEKFALYLLRLTNKY